MEGSLSCRETNERQNSRSEDTQTQKDTNRLDTVLALQPDERDERYLIPKSLDNVHVVVVGGLSGVVIR